MQIYVLRKKERRIKIQKDLTKASSYRWQKVNSAFTYPRMFSLSKLLLALLAFLLKR